ncbi:MAG: GNAT family N-acetyltransferase [Fimbriimonadia bacterium]
MLTLERPAPSIEFIAGPEALASLREEWCDLQDRGGVRTFFQTWEWNSTWWRHFGSGTPLVLRVMDGHSTIGIAPGFVGRSPGRPFRWIGSGNSDYLGVIALPGHLDVVANLVARELEGASAAYLDLRQIPDGSPIHVRYAEHCTPDARAVQLRLPRSWDEYSRMLSAKMRSNLKRGHRDLASLGGRIRLLDRGEVEEGMNALFALHSSRWRRRGLPGSFASRAARAFHLDWARQAADRGWLKLYALEVSGRKVAMLYGVQYGSTFAYYQAGFDPAYSRLSPGALLVGRAIRDAIDDGCDWFDFLRGEEKYKSRWKAEHTEMHWRLLMPLRGWLGQAECELQRRLHVVESRLKARFEGGSLFAKPE